MEIEIAAVITIKNKLPLLENLLDRRIERASLDIVSPALPLLQKVHKLCEYKRLAANLSVMEHRIRCALGEEETDRIAVAALGQNGLHLHNRRVRAALRKARKVLAELHVTAENLEGYRRLPLFSAECRKIEKSTSAALAALTTNELPMPAPQLLAIG